jgi:hypothetical protein
VPIILQILSQCASNVVQLDIWRVKMHVGIISCLTNLMRASHFGVKHFGHSGSLHTLYTCSAKAQTWRSWCRTCFLLPLIEATLFCILFSVQIVILGYVGALWPHTCIPMSTACAALEVLPDAIFLSVLTVLNLPQTILANESQAIQGHSNYMLSPVWVNCIVTLVV